MDILPNGATPAPEPTPEPDAQPLRADVPPPVLDAALLERIAQQLVGAYRDPRDTRTVQEVIDAYLKQASEEVSARTLELRVRTLKLFAQHFGTMQVAHCTPLQLKTWLGDRKNWSSRFSKMRVNADIQRIFNWASHLRFIRENPFRGLRVDHSLGVKRTGREMHAEEFRALLRTTDAAFRRFLMALKMTGARPSELSALQWYQINWEKGLAVLEHHKTSRKTEKPRVLVFSPPVMKLLAWIFRHRNGSAAAELLHILLAAPNRTLGVREVAKKMRAQGFSYRQIYGARRVIGAKFERVGGWGDKGRTVYILPPNPVEQPTPHADYVFLCSKRCPWNRLALGTKFSRLRKQLHLPMACRLYGLRHAFITDGVRRNVNLKALATIVGHSDTRMIETTYCHVDQDFAFLRTAVLQALGQAGLAEVVIKKPTQTGLGAPSAEEASAPPEPGSIRDVIALLIRRIKTLEEEAAAAKQSRVPAPEPKLNASQKIAYEAAQWAMAQNPALAHATDLEVFEWLAKRPEYEGQLPPTFVSFKRYLHHARRLIDQCGKREQRRKNWKPPETNGQTEKGGSP